MRSLPRLRLSLLLAFLLALSLVLPALALGVAGEPVPGAEIFLQQQPGDDPIAPPRDDGFYWLGGEELVNGDCTIAWPDGAVPVGTEMTVTVGFSEVGERAADGGIVKRVALFRPSGLTFPTGKELTLALTCPPGLSNPRMYLKDPGTGAWQSVSGTRNGNIVVSDIKHFSIYGVGGDPIVTSTPASSDWSVALAVALALGMALVLRQRRVGSRA